MSGHSKWHSIKHKKGAADAKRGKIFTRLIREITVSAREAGGDPDMNPRLRKAVADAKAANMPADNIDRAIKRGTGEIEGVSYEEITYEAYGPGGVAILIETMTDNRNRTVAELRHLLSKNNGNLGESGSVAWMFDRKGYLVVPKEQKSEDELFEIAIEAGAEDMKDDDSNFEIFTAQDVFEDVKKAVADAGIEPDVAEVSMIPQNYVKLEGPDAQAMMKLYEAIDDHDDVQNVYSNFDIDEEDLTA
ncbi:MAG: YebC/PmpR family DNA-binding transcriptional regulator [Acidobacteria bacterium]|nr:MAG: YebC/PmpR family DNA-binding transcriptional regulator [Acidobacteriota bacterium]REK03976.1 MAG: YebC/PmpR family DNA-binding transcriptional regulator [Acidobacteriota bacterium]REK15138.1 MAG: YebC/PmpR family DNA-binding transcriptional regulator [Acidobacteriota bacterium]REK46228.1 MAG: YebC/PmpR family DNA-binding transcriptional regulator [Acidobacteriota bacterium]